MQTDDVLANMVDVRGHGFPIDLELCKQYSDAETFFLRDGVVEALLRAKALLPDGYTFLIKDGFRTLETQRKIVERTEQELRQSHPEHWQTLLVTYTGGYEDLEETTISYMNHRSGKTVDLTIVHGGTELDMGGVTLTERDQLMYFETHVPISEADKTIRDNRRLLVQALESVGFEAYPLEWWHWGYAR